MKYQLVKFAGGAAMAIGLVAVSAASASASNGCDTGNSHDTSGYSASSNQNYGRGQTSSYGGGYGGNSQSSGYQQVHANISGNSMTYDRGQYSNQQMTGKGYQDVSGRWVPYSSTWTDQDWQNYRQYCQQQNQSY